MKFKVGDKVKLNKNIKKFKYGQGGVGYDEIGRITRIDKDGFALVDFPKMCDWSGEEHELVSINKTKFFKKLPNDFTGTLEVENGFIVEKEILDDAEKEYLKNVIKPFKNRISDIVKRKYDIEESYIVIHINNGSSFYFPKFKKGTMYEGMKVDKEYTLKELGLDE